MVAIAARHKRGGAWKVTSEERIRRGDVRWKPPESANSSKELGEPRGERERERVAAIVHRTKQHLGWLQRRHGTALLPPSPSSRRCGLPLSSSHRLHPPTPSVASLSPPSSLLPTAPFRLRQQEEPISRSRERAQLYPLPPPPPSTSGIPSCRAALAARPPARPDTCGGWGPRAVPCVGGRRRGQHGHALSDIDTAALTCTTNRKWTGSVRRHYNNRRRCRGLRCRRKRRHHCSRVRIASGRGPSAAPVMGARMRAGGGPARGGECGGGGAAFGPVMGSLYRLRQNGIGEENAVDMALPRRQRLGKSLTIPTLLTLGRVAAVPLLVSTFYMDSQWATTATTTIFIAAAFTDWLDGYIARKMCLGTAFGAFLDPVADKLMVATTLVLLCTKPLKVSSFDKLPWLLTVPSIVIIGREITMSAVREWAASQNSRVSEAVAVNNLGKWKTAIQMAALTILLATRDCRWKGAGFLVPSGVALLYVSSVLALWSLAVYVRKIWRTLLK